ncbi:MAG: hypothetical protein V4563_17065 [Pseudomonadota bacterium]
MAHHMTIKARVRQIESQKRIIVKMEQLRAVHPEYMSEDSIDQLKETLARMENKHSRLIAVNA